MTTINGIVYNGNNKHFDFNLRIFLIASINLKFIQSRRRHEVLEVLQSIVTEIEITQDGELDLLVCQEVDGSQVIILQLQIKQFL